MREEMELGLSLGGDASSSSKPFGLLDKIPPTAKEISNNPSKSGLGFCMALGIINSNTTTTTRKSPEEDITNDEYSSEETIKETSRELHLLPLAPIHRLIPSHQQSFPWSSGSSEGGSSGNVPAARGIDVKRLAAAEEVSSPNSSASSFRMDLGIYRGGNVEEENRRDPETLGNDAVGGDDDENGLGKKKLRLSKEQSAYLEESFKEHNTLNPKQKLALAKQLNLRPRQVEVWFQNRRARTKLKQTEVDCEYLKRWCETLTEENRKLHKELQELRALKSSNPFHMQLPATTLTMCPSCERVATTSTASPTATTTTATTKPIDLTISSTATAVATPLPFPLSRPKFYPFYQTPKTNPRQSAPS